MGCPKSICSHCWLPGDGLLAQRVFAAPSNANRGKYGCECVDEAVIGCGGAAIAAAQHAGVPVELSCEALKEFQGIKRRLEVRGVVNNITVYDDFAHHPTAIEETLAALDDLTRQGSIHYIGCSNFTAWRLMQALWASDRHQLHRFICVQPHYNLVHREEYERELMEVCAVYGLGVMPYSPLAGGFLSQKGKLSLDSEQRQGSHLSGRAMRYLKDLLAGKVLEKTAD